MDKQVGFDIEPTLPFDALGEIDGKQGGMAERVGLCPANGLVGHFPSKRYGRIDNESAQKRRPSSTMSLMEKVAGLMRRRKARLCFTISR